MRWIRMPATLLAAATLAAAATAAPTAAATALPTPPPATAQAAGLTAARPVTAPATASAVPPAGAVAAPAGSASVCGPAAPGFARCYAEVRTGVYGGTGPRGPRLGTALPSGYGPADLRSAYQLPETGGAGQTIAIVDAGGDPTAEADLAVYRSTYGLPACTAASGCFREVGQTGAASPLPPDQGWGTEIALDLELASAACPSCHLLLVEGDSAAFADLAAAEDTAAALGATEISNSYGAFEGYGIGDYAAAYRHPGVAVVASSGDAGYTLPSAPAVFGSVVAVGGTTLTRTGTGRGWSEAAWAGAGSGCSAWIDKPSWQQDPNCPGRMVADVAADADPDTGVAVYDSSGDSTGLPGWLVAGGTSASAPFIAGVIALAGHPALFPDAAHLYDHPAGLNDVVGSNSSNRADCGGDYQCTAVAGYDGPTGNGTPAGLTAF
jgi:hypothetical protein